MNLTVLLLASAAASSLGATAAAQTVPAPAPTSDAITIGEVVVTATKREQNLKEIPASITALGGDLLARKAQQNVEDLNGSVPGLQVSPLGPQTSVIVRGVGHSLYSAAAENSVALHLDGIYLGDPAAAAGGFFDLDRIEVLRGPQGTLYGRNATGGAINMISGSPTTDFTGHVAATLGNYRRTDVEGVVSGPLSETVSARFGVFYHRRGEGFGRNLGNGDKLDDLNEGGGKAALQFRPNDRLKILLRGDFYHSDDSYGLYHTAGDVRPPFPGAKSLPELFGAQFPANIRDQISETTNHRNVTADGVSLEINYELTDSLSVKSLTGYRQTITHYIEDLDFSTLPIFGPFSFNATANQKSEELQLNWHSDELYVIAGAYYFTQSTRSHLHISDYLNAGIPQLHIPSILPAPFGMFNQIGKMEIEAKALYLNADWTVTDRLTLGGGLRYSEESKSNSGSQVAFFPPLVVVDDTRDSHALTPRFTANYKLTSDVNIYGSVSRGFKSGEFIAGSNQYAQPEKLWAYEVGLKGTAFERHLGGSLSAFYYDYENLQVQRLQSPLTFLDNVPKGVLKGVEAEATARLPHQFSIDGNLTLLHTRMIGFKSQNPNIIGSPTVDLTGNRFAFAPEIAFNLGVEKRLDEGSFGEGILRVDYQYTGDTYLDIFNSKTAGFRPGYSIWNASYSHTLPGHNWSLLFWGKNLGNKTVFLNNTITNEPDLIIPTVGVVRPFPVASVSLVNLNDPRTFGVTVKYKW